MDEEIVFAFAFALIVIGLIACIYVPIADFANPGELCEQRGFDSWYSLYVEGGKEYFCSRGLGNNSENRPLEWVRENCNGRGVCTKNEGS